MTKTKNTKSGKLKCAFCQGKGVQPGAERLSCIVCGGSGRITAKQPYSICKECGGTGKKKGATLYCLACRGKGFVEKSRHPSLAKSPASKTTRRNIKKMGKGKFNKRKRARKSARKKGLKSQPSQKRESFFKGFLRTFKIL